MKKLLLIGLTLLSTNLSAKEEKKDWFNIEASYSPWLMSWQQNSTANKKFGSQALDVTYQIDSAVAHSATLTAHLFSWEFDLNLITVPESENSNKQADSMDSLSATLSYLDFIGDTELKYSYYTGEFKGAVIASDLDRFGGSVFKSEVTQHNFVINTQWDIGFGVRVAEYDLPQDVYLVEQANANQVLLSGLANMEYDATFYQITFSKDKLFQFNNGSHIGVIASAGFGEMTSSGDCLQQVEQLVGDKSMGDADAYFVEYDIFYADKFSLTKSIDAHWQLGYRANSIEAEFSPSGQYTLVADFETEFKGPYISFNAIW